MTTPIFLMELARERLSKRHFLRATVQAEIYDPDSAIGAGFLDRLFLALDRGIEIRVPDGGVYCVRLRPEE